MQVSVGAGNNPPDGEIFLAFSQYILKSEGVFLENIKRTKLGRRLFRYEVKGFLISDNQWI